MFEQDTKTNRMILLLITCKLQAMVDSKVAVLVPINVGEEDCAQKSRGRTNNNQKRRFELKYKNEMNKNNENPKNNQQEPTKAVNKLTNKI